MFNLHRKCNNSFKLMEFFVFMEDFLVGEAVNVGPLLNESCSRHWRMNQQEILSLRVKYSQGYPEEILTFRV